MSAPKPHLCFVIPSLGIGGSERQVLHLLHGLNKHFDLTVICTRDAGAWIDEARPVAHIEVLTLRGGWDPRLKSKLTALFRQLQPDIVHSFMFGFDYAVNVAARAAHVPVVIASRRQRATWKKPRHLRLQKKANQLVDAIVANSQAVADYAAEQEGQPLDQYRVILNGIDRAPFQTPAPKDILRQDHGLPSDKKIVGIVANFSPIKNHALFLEIATTLMARRDDLHFLMVGSGPQQHDIEQALHGTPLKAHTTILHAENNIAALYGLLDVQVLCSHSEGFPNVIMEGMAAGVPIVSARVGGVPELIDHGDTGWLVDTPIPKTYADHIEWCLDTPDAVALMTQRAREIIAERASLETMLEHYTLLYTTLLAQKGAR